jgi:SAM-dependent methyltransferase
VLLEVVTPSRIMSVAAQSASSCPEIKAASDDDPLHVDMPSWEDVAAFLRRANPSAYGSPVIGAARSPNTSVAQVSALDDAARGIFQMMNSSAAKSSSGLLRAGDCPIMYTDNDPRNVWVHEGRFHASTRTVSLPYAGLTATIQQRWNEHEAGGRRRERGDELTEIEGHSTAAVCWDGSVVLADLICLPPPVLLAHSATLARSPAAYAGWRWAEKTVVELGCGIAALPSLAAARNGARRVVCTDGNEDVLMATRANAQQWVREHPGVVAPLTMPLVWGDGDRACNQLRALGVEAPVDVILAADCIYVLENPGAWGKLLKTIAALSTPHTLIFITYTDRGHNKLWDRFVAERVEKLFHVVRVEKHLLHPVAESGAVGRLEQHLPPVEVFCWTLKDVSS